MCIERKSPIIIPPSLPTEDSSSSAAFIFMHGLGDDAEGIENIPRQFQAASKLPYMTWVLPNALENHSVMQTAWYIPTRLSPFPTSRPELEDEEDEHGMKSSVVYIESLIDDLVSKGVPEKRIILGGFSQGCAISLLTGMVSKKYAGKLGGLLGLSGYLPLSDRIPALREDAGLTRHVDDNVEIFLARGTRDLLVPKRHFRLCYESLFGFGVKEAKATVREYEGMGHVMGATELRDMCEWLERVVPPLR